MEISKETELKTSYCMICGHYSQTSTENERCISPCFCFDREKNISNFCIPLFCTKVHMEGSHSESEKQKCKLYTPCLICEEKYCISCFTYGNDKMNCFCCVFCYGNEQDNCYKCYSPLCGYNCAENYCYFGTCVMPYDEEKRLDRYYGLLPFLCVKKQNGYSFFGCCVNGEIFWPCCVKSENFDCCCYCYFRHHNRYCNPLCCCVEKREIKRYIEGNTESKEYNKFVLENKYRYYTEDLFVGICGSYIRKNDQPPVQIMSDNAIMAKYQENNTHT